MNKSNGFPIYVGTEYADDLGFTPDKFEGYLWDSRDGSIVISVIFSLDPGKGNVRSLINTLKSRFNKITVPVPSNRMRMICERMGFKYEVLYSEFGKCESMIWIKDVK